MGVFREVEVFLPSAPCSVAQRVHAGYSLDRGSRLSNVGPKYVYIYARYMYVYIYIHTHMYAYIFTLYSNPMATSCEVSYAILGNHDPWAGSLFTGYGKSHQTVKGVTSPEP